MKYVATYAELFCVNDDLAQIVTQEISSTVNSILSTIPCVDNKACLTKDVSVVNCKPNNRRKRSMSQAGFVMTITSVPSNGKQCTV